MSVTSARHRCDKCGAPARVNITNDESQEAGVRHLCLACADLEETSGRRRRRYLNYGVILISVGLAVLTLSALADWLAFGVDSPGFGWKQSGGVILAGVLVVTAALMQIPTLLVIGVFLGGLTLIADWAAFGSAPGFGLHQTIGTVVGLIMIGFGVVESRRKA